MPDRTRHPKAPAKRRVDDSAAFAKALRRPPGPRFVLKLYVTGSTPRSVQAVQNIRKICEQHLRGHYKLEIIDLYQEPWRARRDQLAVAPTLIKKLPLPLRRLVGDMSKTENVLAGLDLKAERAAAAPAPGNPARKR